MSSVSGIFPIRIQNFAVTTMHLLYLLSLLAVVSPAGALTKPCLKTKTVRFQRYLGSCHPKQAQCRSHLFLKPEASEESEPRENIIMGAFVATSLCASSGVLWSEWTVFQTGCGPLYLPDWLERSCYLGVLFVSGLSAFLRIVYRQGLSSWVHASARRAVQACESLAWLAIVGAVIVLLNQMLIGETIDGLSGIDLEKCRAKQAFATQFTE